MDISLDTKKVCFQSNHLERLQQFYRLLGNIKNEENSLISIDLVFFDSLTILRNYVEDPELGALLSELKLIHTKEYPVAHDKRGSIKRKSATVRKYKSSVRQIIRNAIQLQNK